MQIRYLGCLLYCLSLFALIGYVWYTLDSTVFGRTDFSEYRYKTIPFWSYVAIFNGKTNLIKEDILNVALFVPIGFLLCHVLFYRRWWLALMIGFGLSAGIEFMQLIWKRGICEFDDVFHNTIGCVIGYFFALLVVEIFKDSNFKKEGI